MCYFPQSVCIHFENQARKEQTLGIGILSSKDVADLYAQQCVLAADSEPRTASMIDTSITIYKCVMQVGRLKTIMLASCLKSSKPFSSPVCANSFDITSSSFGMISL